MNKVLYILCIFLFSSCATVINRNSYNLKVQSINPEKISIQVNDSIYETPANIKVYRTNKDLTIIAKHDTKSKIYVIKKYLSPVFLYGNLGFVQICPAAYIIDLFTNKKYTYGKEVLLNIQDSIHVINNSSLLKFIKRFPYIENEKNQFYVKISIPEFNFFHLNKKTKYGNSSGFLGITSELGYYYSNKCHISIGAGVLLDFLNPARYDKWGSYEKSSGTFINIKNNYDLKRLTFGFGLNVSELKFYKEGIDSSNIYESYSLKEFKYGVTISTTFKLTNKIQIGLNYLPSFNKINDFKNVNYTHLIYIDFLLYNFDKRRKRKI